MKITPVLTVKEIEPCLPFWVGRMGFQNLAQMPEPHKSDRIGFVMLQRDGVELMIQSAASVSEDEPAFAPGDESRVASLYIEVDDFADTLKRLEGYPLAMKERTTFYGMREVGVFDPAGNIVMFGVKA
ncbi:MAG TPA: VOC family protein [Bryobacteraceae bacterium]|nr:VOC family protein [Bryobacteraceae bacterium]